ncbi:MAG: acyltransferase family protein [Candidatus Helarchaeota archaeon]
MRIVPLYCLTIILWGINFYSIGVQFSVNEYLINLTFLFQFILGKNLGIVGGVGWFLGPLIVFYLIFPILVIFIRKVKVALIVFVGMLFIASYFNKHMLSVPGIPTSFASTFFIYQMPFFLLGILLYLILKDKITDEAFLYRRQTKIIGIGLLITCIIGFSLFSWPNAITVFLYNFPYFDADFYIWGVFLGAFFVGLILFPWKGLVNRTTRFLGDRSYSIYLIHPVIIFVSLPVFSVIYENILNLTLAYLIGILFLFGTTVGISILTYRYIEQPALKYGSAYFLQETSRETSLNSR